MGKKYSKIQKIRNYYLLSFFRTKKGGMNEQTSLGVLLYSSTNYKRGDRPAKV